VGRFFEIACVLVRFNHVASLLSPSPHCQRHREFDDVLFGVARSQLEMKVI
jgi:hypothetical protein